MTPKYNWILAEDITTTVFIHVNLVTVCSVGGHVWDEFFFIKFLISLKFILVSYTTPQRHFFSNEINKLFLIHPLPSNMGILWTHCSKDSLLSCLQSEASSVLTLCPPPARTDDFFPSMLVLPQDLSWSNFYCRIRAPCLVVSHIFLRLLVVRGQKSFSP